MLLILSQVSQYLRFLLPGSAGAWGDCGGNAASPEIQLPPFTTAEKSLEGGKAFIWFSSIELESLGEIKRPAGKKPTTLL